MRNTEALPTGIVKQTLSNWALAALLLTAGHAYAQSGTVTTLGGTGSAGFTDGTKGSSEFNTPAGIAVRGDGVLFIADYSNNAVRSLTLAGTRTKTFARGNHPIGLAFDSSTNLYVANQGDGTITKFDYFGNLRQTLRPPLTGGSMTALAIDRDANLYVAQLNGLVTRINRDGFVDTTFSAPATGAHAFRGVAVADDGTVYVSDSTAHVIWRFAGVGSAAEVFGGTLNAAGRIDGEQGIGRLNSPYQIAIGLNGSIVVADRGNHQVRVVSCSGVVTTLYGIEASEWFTTPAVGVYPGWWDSSAEFAELREPTGVAVDKAGNVFDTEGYYNLVRGASGLSFPASCGTSGTGNGTNAAPIPVLNPNSGYYPNGVTVSISASNSITGFGRDVRLFYTIDGSEPTTNSIAIPINGSGIGVLELNGPIDLAVLKVRAFLGALASPVVNARPTAVPTPVLEPNAGYYPMGVDVRITSTNGFPEGTILYYTDDGTEPNTNSHSITPDRTSGTIVWGVPQRDLRSLRVKAVLGPNSGVTTAGAAVNFGDDHISQGEVGIPPGRHELNAGIGSFYIVPIVVNLRDQQSLKSLQFQVELSPAPGSPRLERFDIHVLPISTNDFIQVFAASTQPPDRVIPLVPGGVNQLTIGYFGTNTGFNVSRGFATVALLGIQFRAEDSFGTTAEPGDTYNLRIKTISGTSDGMQTMLPLRAMPDRTIRLKNIQFREGDTSPAYWYNAGDFGNDVLENGDINTAVYAAFGFHRPFPGSDAFAAMDVYRNGLLENVIEFSDAETILLRSAFIDSPDVFRVRDEFGLWQSSMSPIAPPPPSMLSAASLATTEEPVWDRDVLIYGGIVENAGAMTYADVPVYMKVRAGRTVTGMQFVADVIGENGAPSVEGVTFMPSGAISAPQYNASVVPDLGTLPHTVYVRWTDLDPGFNGTVLLGTIRFLVPNLTAAGQSYSVVFHETGGAFMNSEGKLRGYVFEGTRGQVWPYVSHVETSRVSDDWKQSFFGLSDAPDAEADQDPDGDGFNNYEEYLAGSDPKAPNWHVRHANGQLTVRWVGETGKSYTVERTTDFKSWNAASSQLNGEEGFMEYNELTPGSKVQFYRIKAQ